MLACGRLAEGAQADTAWPDTFMCPTKAEHLTLARRLGDRDENGEWRLKR
jgi:hypothetical protein